MRSSFEDPWAAELSLIGTKGKGERQQIVVPGTLSRYRLYGVTSERSRMKIPCKNFRMKIPRSNLRMKIPRFLGSNELPTSAHTGEQVRMKFSW